MAENILEELVASDQSRDLTFSITFTQVQWQKFWQFINVSSMMSDYLLYANEEYAEGPQHNVRTADKFKLHVVSKWVKLSEELTPVLSNCKVEYKVARTP